MPVYIEEWSCVVGLDNPWVPPEVVGTALRGRVYGHARKLDDERVHTSRIVSVVGRTVTTASGTIYVLGEPDPKWVAWLAEHGYQFDPAEPIKLRSFG